MRADEVFKRLFAAFLDELVGVVVVGQSHKAQGFSRFQQRQNPVRRAVCRANARAVAVETANRFGRVFPQLFDLPFGQRRAARCDRARNANAVKRDDVHIAFDHQNFLHFSRLFRCQVRGVKGVAFGKQSGFGRIQILRFAVAQNAPAESDDASAFVANRVDDAIVEIVVRPSVRRKADDACLLQLFGGQAVAFQHRFDGIAVRREAKAEMLDNVVRQPAPL